MPNFLHSGEHSTCKFPFAVEGVGTGDKGSEYIGQGSGFEVYGSGFRVQGSGFGAQGSGLMVQGSVYTSSAVQSSASPSGSATNTPTVSSQWRAHLIKKPMLLQDGLRMSVMEPGSLSRANGA